jgi:hypothetical protein
VRFRTFLLVATLALLASLPTVRPSVAQESTEDQSANGEGVNRPNAISWNLCSESCNLATGESGYVLFDAYQAALRKPRAIATQEMWETDWEVLTDSLPGSTYDWQFYVATEDPNEDICDRYGNGIFWAGGCGGPPPCYVNGPFSAQFGGGEDRGFAYGTSADYTFTACSAHMDTADSQADPADPPVPGVRRLASERQGIPMSR